MANVSERDILTYKIYKPDIDHNEYISNLLKSGGQSNNISSNNIHYKKLNNNRDSLEKAKSRLDQYPLPESYKITHGEDAFMVAKKDLLNRYNIPFITNAWIKCYEMLKEFNLLSNVKTKINYFDNAAFPGAFILATRYYTNLKYKKLPFHWKASSLINTDGALLDTYCIYKNNPDNFIMTDKDNGDVTSFHFHKNLSKNVTNMDLYTSDIAISAIGRYEKEEEANLPIHMGQVICALITLKQGGNAVFKTFTYTHLMSLNIIEFLTVLFDTVYITKPATSRPLNSEVYLVCKGYNIPDKLDKFVKLLQDYISGKYHYIHTYKNSQDHMDFLKSVLKSDFIHVSQTAYLNKIIDVHETLRSLKQEGNKILQECSQNPENATKQCERAYNKIKDKYNAIDKDRTFTTNSRKTSTYNRWLRWANLKKVDNPYKGLSIGC